MFRKMRRSGQEISAEECRKVLREGNRAVLSVLGEDGYPYGVPVNFFYNEAENIIYLHGAREGHKIDAIKANDKVCFTTWDKGFLKEGDWAWYLNSVIIRGRADLLNDLEKAEAEVRRLAEKYYPAGREAEIEKDIRKSIERVQLIAIHIEHMTGKLVHEK